MHQILANLFLNMWHALMDSCKYVVEGYYNEVVDIFFKMKITLVL